MREKMGKMLNLISAPHRIERIRLLFEVRFNRWVFANGPSDVDSRTFEEFLSQLSHNNPMLFNCLKLGGEAEVAVQSIRSEFNRLAQERKRLPFPTFYDADTSLALLSYGLTRYLTPELVL